MPPDFPLEAGSMGSDSLQMLRQDGVHPSRQPTSCEGQRKGIRHSRSWCTCAVASSEKKRENGQEPWSEKQERERMGILERVLSHQRGMTGLPKLMVRRREMKPQHAQTARRLDSKWFMLELETEDSRRSVSKKKLNWIRCMCFDSVRRSVKIEEELMKVTLERKEMENYLQVNRVEQNRKCKDNIQQEIFHMTWL